MGVRFGRPRALDRLCRVREWSQDGLPDIGGTPSTERSLPHRQSSDSWEAELAFGIEEGPEKRTECCEPRMAVAPTIRNLLRPIFRLEPQLKVTKMSPVGNSRTRE